MLFLVFGITSGFLLTLLLAHQVEPLTAVLWWAGITLAIKVVDILEKLMQSRVVEVMDKHNGMAQGNASKGARKQGWLDTRQEGEQIEQHPVPREDEPGGHTH